MTTKTFIEYEERILVLRESNSYADGTNTGKFDVIGGRMELGQKFDESLKREVKEETGLEIFTCKSKSNKARLSKDYDAYKWIDQKNFRDAGFIKNLFPAFEAYLQNT